MKLACVPAWMCSMRNNNCFSAKRDLLQARYNYLVNIIRLKTASGLVAEADLQDINQQLVVQSKCQLIL